MRGLDLVQVLAADYRIIVLPLSWISTQIANKNEKCRKIWRPENLESSLVDLYFHWDIGVNTYLPGDVAFLSRLKN